MTRHIIVITTHLERLRSGTITVQDSQRVIDYDIHADRKWLAKHSYWAMRNGRKVETYPVTFSESAGVWISDILHTESQP